MLILSPAAGRARLATRHRRHLSPHLPHGGAQSSSPITARRSDHPHLGAACRGADPRPDPPIPLAVAPLAALPRLPCPVPAAGSGHRHHLLPALPLPRRLPSPLGADRRLPPALGAPVPAAVVLALPVPVPAPAAARALRRHRAGARAVGRGRAPGLRAPAAGAEGASEGAAAALRGRGGAHHRAQHRDHRGHHPRALLGPAQPHLRICWIWKHRDLGSSIKHRVTLTRHAWGHLLTATDTEHSAPFMPKEAYSSPTTSKINLARPAPVIGSAIRSSVVRHLLFSIPPARNKLRQDQPKVSDIPIPWGCKCS